MNDKDRAHDPQQIEFECGLIRQATSPEDTLLHLGCGGRRLTAPLADHFREIHTVDLSHLNLEQAQRPNVRHFAADPVEFEPPRVADVVLFTDLCPMLDDERLGQLIERLRRRVCGPLLIRTTVATKYRVEAIEQSDEMGPEAYTLYYRTPGELIAAFQSPPVMHLYNVVPGWTLEAAHELYRHQDYTAAWWFAFEPRYPEAL